jgi:hypothetical protein
MLAALVRLATTRPEVITCRQEAVAELQRRGASLGLGRSVIVGWLSRNQQLLEYAKMDAGFVRRDDNRLNQVAMPTKLLAYMA